MPADEKITNDATASVSGTVYQICVALERSFMLEEGQKLWIERFGDVTISGQAQLEIKLYNDALTDNHQNFWNTLKNWLLPSFDHAQYVDLVLFTTQSFGPSSKLQEWNDSAANHRLDLLKSIKQESEERFLKIQETRKDAKIPPQPLLNQRFVLDDSRLQQLQEIIPKISISSKSPKIIKLCKKILDVHGKFILQAKVMLNNARQAAGDPDTEVTVGADKGYNAQEFIQACLKIQVTPAGGTKYLGTALGRS